MNPLRNLYFGATILYATTILFCEGQSVYVPLWMDRTEIRSNITGTPNVTNSWIDSYSVGSHCYCTTNFDHQIGGKKVMTPLGRLSIRQVCGLLGPGPGKSGRPVYNDIQCGNGPSANISDEVICPGRADHGKKGCKHIGPKWNFNITAFMVPTKVPTLSPIQYMTPKPTWYVTSHPQTSSPSLNPSSSPSWSPYSKTTSTRMFSKPTQTPTMKPILQPTSKPIEKPILKPTSKKPTLIPSSKPTYLPITRRRTSKPTRKSRTTQPTMKPVSNPTTKPTLKPTSKPIVKPTLKPTLKPSANPTDVPIRRPTNKPTRKPRTTQPTMKPTRKPRTTQPTMKPISNPTTKPTIFGLTTDIVNFVSSRLNLHKYSIESNDDTD